MGFLCALQKEFQKEETLIWEGGSTDIKRIFQIFLLCKSKILVGLVSVATELSSVTQRDCYHFRKCRQLHGKSNRVELIMKEMAEHDTDSRVVTHMHALGNVL